jgi:hypothetical protein
MARRWAAFASRIGLAMCALTVLSASVRAIERKPLPAFELTALDGGAIRSGDLVRKGQWLLIYLRPACAPCDTLLRTIDPKTAGPLPTRTVVVIGGVDAAGASKLAAGFKELPGIAWYADPTAAMSAVLPVAGAPVVFGMRADMVEWSIAGIVPSTASMQTALMSWAGPGR